MEAIKENWTTIKEAVRREYSLSDISYHTWVEPLEFHNVVNDVVSIAIAGTKCTCLPWKGRCRTNVRRGGVRYFIVTASPPGGSQETHRRWLFVNY